MRNMNIFAQKFIFILLKTSKCYFTPEILFDQINHTFYIETYVQKCFTLYML